MPFSSLKFIYKHLQLSSYLSSYINKLSLLRVPCTILLLSAQCVHREAVSATLDDDDNMQDSSYLLYAYIFVSSHYTVKYLSRCYFFFPSFLQSKQGREYALCIKPCIVLLLAKTAQISHYSSQLPTFFQTLWHGIQHRMNEELTKVQFNTIICVYMPKVLNNDVFCLILSCQKSYFLFEKFLSFLCQQNMSHFSSPPLASKMKWFYFFAQQWANDYLLVLFYNLEFIINKSASIF